MSVRNVGSLIREHYILIISMVEEEKTITNMVAVFVVTMLNDHLQLSKPYKFSVLIVTISKELRTTK